LQAAGKKLAVTVHPKLSEPGTQARTMVQDWRAIGSVAHEVRIMLYDYSPRRGPASQSPLHWWKQQAQFAVHQIPSHKILLGAPSYGYRWVQGKKRPQDLEWATIERLRRRMGATRTRDPGSGSLHVAYDSGSKRHDIWYEDARALAERAQVVRDNGMLGLFVWRLGGEDPRTWAAVRSALDRP
jgi:spore germination protein YaaH